MQALAFFLAGLPLVFIASYLVVRLTDGYEEEFDEDEEGEELLVQTEHPWQVEPWPARVRWAVVALLPPLMAVAGSRFEVGQALLVSLLVGALLVCTATDLLRYRIPNQITYPSILIALVAAVFMPDADLQGAVIAASAAGGISLVIAVLLSGWGFGLGDVKLLTFIGALLGPLATWNAIVFGVMSAGLFLLPVYVLSRLGIGKLGMKDTIPYGPFLAMAAAVVALLQGTAFAPL